MASMSNESRTQDRGRRGADRAVAAGRHDEALGVGDRRRAVRPPSSPAVWRSPVRWMKSGRTSVDRPVRSARCGRTPRRRPPRRRRWIGSGSRPPGTRRARTPAGNCDGGRDRRAIDAGADRDLGHHRVEQERASSFPGATSIAMGRACAREPCEEERDSCAVAPGWKAARRSRGTLTSPTGRSTGETRRGATSQGSRCTKRRGRRRARTAARCRYDRVACPAGCSRCCVDRPGRSHGERSFARASPIRDRPGTHARLPAGQSGTVPPSSAFCRTESARAREACGRRASASGAARDRHRGGAPRRVGRRSRAAACACRRPRDVGIAAMGRAPGARRSRARRLDAEPCEAHGRVARDQLIYAGDL
jgi:hypothetical protein